MRQQRLDELTRRDHYYVDEQDLCYFFLEYSARRGLSFGASNALIRDLVRPESQVGFGPDVPKQRAIRRLAQIFKGALNAGQIGAITFVPLPQARSRDDPRYDDRVLRLLSGVADGLDVRELIEWVGTQETGDFAGVRTGPDVLYANFHVVPGLMAPAPALIMLVGDVLTTGANFVAARRRLRQALPAIPVCGLFAARRTRDADEIPHLDG